MKVLSLFDGISCGRIALERAGINVERYVAYEIDENAIKISKNNWNDIEYRGDVLEADFTEFKDFDLLIGGSPCQNLSSMGDGTGLKGEKSKLFFEYLRALKEVKPKYFLLENNYSMSKKNKELISDYMGIDPIMIDSGDFSAQTRKRLYWTNVDILHYEKKNIVIKDILEDCDHEDITEKVSKYICGDYSGRKIEKCVKSSIRELNSKSRTICTRSHDISSNSGLCYKINDRYYKPTLTEFERLQTLPDGYTKCDGVKENKSIFAIGNGWTVDVIAHILRGIK